MLKFAPFAISLVSLAVLPVACGSSKDSQIDGTGTGTGAGGGPPNIVVGGAGPLQRTAVDASLQAIMPASLTPTHDAYKSALDSGLSPYMTTANKFMLLITDGAPTMSLGCISGTTGGRRGGNTMDMPTAPIIAAIAGAKAMNIRTFIIGSPGSQMSSPGGMDMRPWLS